MVFLITIMLQTIACIIFSVRSNLLLKNKRRISAPEKVARWLRASCVPKKRRISSQKSSLTRLWKPQLLLRFSRSKTLAKVNIQYKQSLNYAPTSWTSQEWLIYTYKAVKWVTSWAGNSRKMHQHWLQKTSQIPHSLGLSLGLNSTNLYDSEDLPGAPSSATSFTWRLMTFFPAFFQSNEWQLHRFFGSGPETRVLAFVGVF
jgi:hypothetical protein